MIPTDPHNNVTCAIEYESSSEEEVIEGTAGPNVGPAVTINYKKLKSLRNARELALFAEKKWILKALSSIRKQRNALKVESLYYHGLKANLFAKHAAQFGAQSPTHQPSLEPVSNDIELEPVPEHNYFEVEPDLQNEELLPPSSIEDFNTMEKQCNDQELKNLSIVDKKPEQLEDDEQEYESDEEPWKQVNLDMGMLVGMDDEPDAAIRAIINK